jgi:hypothetical protein
MHSDDRYATNDKLGSYHKGFCVRSLHFSLIENENQQCYMREREWEREDSECGQIFRKVVIWQGV